MTPLRLSVVSGFMITAGLLGLRTPASAAALPRLECAFCMQNTEICPDQNALNAQCQSQCGTGYTATGCGDSDPSCADGVVITCT